jgi:hypothetical protein
MGEAKDVSPPDSFVTQNRPLTVVPFGLGSPKPLLVASHRLGFCRNCLNEKACIDIAAADFVWKLHFDQPENL